MSIMFLAALACSGSSDDPTVVVAEQTTIISAEDIERTWVFQAADAEWRGQFEGNPGWEALFNRDYAGALEGSTGAGLVRMHAEYSAIYRQATLLHAHASEHMYNTDRQEEDGVDSLYLRGVARVILGQPESAKEDFEKLDDEKLIGMSSQWNALAVGGYPPSEKIVGNFVNTPPVQVGKEFRPESVPHFSIRTTIEGETSSITDTTELWVRSRWHESMARLLAGQQSMDERWIDVFMVPWHTPMESAHAQNSSQTVLNDLAKLQLDSSWLFLSRNLVAEDTLFLYALQFSESPQNTLESWADKSLLAEILQKCMVDGQLDVPKVLDAASHLESDILNAIKIKQGKEEPFYPLFADFAEQAVLIAGVMLAESNGQREDSGRLRLNARDLALVNSKDAVFLTGFAAWDVANRYPMRAQDMIHKYSQDFPAFKVAGHPLGLLQIRLGRSAGVPGAAN